MSEHEVETLTRKLQKNVWNLTKDYQLIEPGDRIMVCLSGGKDSYTMLDMLLHLQKASSFDFEIVAVNLDQKQPDFPEHILPEYLEQLGVEYKILERDTYSIVKEKIPEGKTMCSLCSRLRRFTLYEAAEKIGMTKIALGHHKDDIIETLFLNLFFAGKIETMPPKYKTNDGRFDVIRPLAYCDESDIAAYSEIKEFPIIPCNLCGTQENMQRQNIKKLISEWDKQFPTRKASIFNAISNVSPSHLMDRTIFDFIKNEEIPVEQQ